MNAMDSGRVSTRGTVNSVRAMALKNHARKENRFIPQDGLSSRIRRRDPRSADDSTSKYRPSAGLATVTADDDAAEGPLGPGEEAAREIKAETPKSSKSSKSSKSVVVPGVGVVEEGDEGSEVAEPAQASTMGSLTQFKLNMNFNLKIGLEDDNDWGKVSGAQGLSSCYPDTLINTSTSPQCALLPCRWKKMTRTMTT
jgi:hypothetical protein